MSYTVEQIRNQFWEDHFDLFEDYYEEGKTQNDYPAEVRVAFINWLDYMVNEGYIGEDFANNEVTL